MQFKGQEIDSPERLAAAMGWSGDQLIGREIRGPSGRPIVLQSAHLDGENAIVFSHFDGHASREDLAAVSLYGYHASSHWGLVADGAGVHVLSARWLRDGDWYRLPPIDGSVDGRDTSLLDVFSPKAVRQSEPTRRLLDYQRPTDFLKAVDEALVERLDAWREKAVRYSRGAVSRIDEQLQTLDVAPST